MNIDRCPCCGWPAAEPFEVVSHHDTSEGTVAYTRCPCGRLQVRSGLGARTPVLVSRRSVASRAVSAAKPLRAGGAPVWWTGGALLLASAAVVPTGALVAGTALFVVAALLGGSWAWLTGAAPGPLGYALRAGAIGGTAGLVLAALAVVVDSALVVTLPVAYLAAGLWFWLARPPRRPCP